MTSRAAIRASVLARVPVDDRERESIRAFVEHFDRLEDPCSEDADPVHVTGSAIIVGRRGVVLHLHKRLQLWLQPGGHIEPGETPWAAARREAEEETGLAVELASPLGTVLGPGEVPELAHVDVHAGPRGHTHLDLRYVLLGADAEPSPPPEESQQVRWFGWDEALAVADAGLAGALIDVRATLEPRL
ncbi:MAG: putative hydrolase [Ilumatobacteraceae bacterium]|nr:putative hydrolase [Ilumatobacteraceae bacterium]